MTEQVFHSVKLLEKKIITPNIWELKFEKPTGFIFQAGQFVQFKVPAGGESALRSYSISSEPKENYLEFCIKYLPDGKASQFFDTLEIGDGAWLSNPKGVFTCANDTGLKKYFIATGTGLAPIMAMLEAGEATSAEQKLLFGVRTEEDIFWLPRLQALHGRTNRFTFEVALSRPSEDWTGKRGRVIDYVEYDPQAHYYICGNVEMVKDVRTKLLEKGLNIKSIHFEIF